ncbi:MAG: hypothetical protein KDC38_09450, partial [Planctomycetes bacterium]|nr:hypothetical protein [Planctomycetota bacterium]
ESVADRLHRYRRIPQPAPPAPSIDAKVLIEDRLDGFISRIQLREVIYRFTFDVHRGRVERVELSVRSDYGTKGTGSVEVALKSVHELTDETLRKRREEVNRYFSVLRDLRDGLHDVTTGREGGRSRVEEARKRAELASQELADPVLRAKVSELVAQFDAQLSRAEGTATNRRAAIGRMSPEWSRVGFDGLQHDQTELTGQVAVLCFWNRANVWSLRAAKRTIELARRHSDVRFIGCNNDPVITDAKYPLQVLSPPFPTIRAAHLAEQFGARVFPAIVVLDRDGKIHDLHEGYTERLYGAIEADLEELRQPTP